MMSNTILNAISAPLNTTCLIQASAGTGKTYTITSLYLRLLLKAAENAFERALRVEEILVVTFTEAATAELKGRIRERIHCTSQLFQTYLKAKNALDKPSELALQQLKAELIKEDFLRELLEEVEADLDLAIQRLTLAERAMDLAPISTIHSFCRRVLMQYAFNSGVHFNLDIANNLDELLEKICQDVWREHFYHQPLPIAQYIHRVLTSPRAVFKQFKNLLNKPSLPVNISQPVLLQMPLAQFLQNCIVPQQQYILDFKQRWLAHSQEIATLVMNEIRKPKGKAKALPARTYQEKRTENSWLPEILRWAENDNDFELPEKLTKYFSQNKLNQIAPEGVAPLTHPLFEAVDELDRIQQDSELYDNVLIYQYAMCVRQAFINYKSSHKEKSFDDLLSLLFEALHDSQGEQLAHFIRQQYPFAMIDEFQDTDSQQYGIFRKIYMQETERKTGFIMIGDPKQAIYKFRGADIFTYLNAAEEAKVDLTLDKNWRSEQGLVDCINALFDFKQPFLYKQIPFTPVKAQANQARFILNGKVEPALRCYIQRLDTESEDSSATSFSEACAISIQQWLKSAQHNQAFFRSEKEERVLLPERIAVLVRNAREAAEIQQALKKLGIASVYLSDKSSVYESAVTTDLLHILKACLNPFNERNVLNAVGCGLWHLDSLEIYRIKQEEIRWTEIVDRFVTYQQLWQRQGILAMLHHLFLQENITQKLLAKVGGEREVTDLLHLAELLQKASAINDSPATLLRWFEKQITGEGQNDHSQIRLESEHQLVKIVTIHKSKGLEYDLVWLPFISAPVRKQKSTFASYYDSNQGTTLLDFEGKQDKEVWQETLAEEMRLLYVALTRAKYQVVLALPEFAEPKWNALQYALFNGDYPESEEKNAQPERMEKLLQGWQHKLKGKNAEIAIEDINVLQASEPLSVQTSAQEGLQSAQFSGKIEQNWQVTSFTSMTYIHDAIQQFKLAQNANGLLSHKIFGLGKDYDVSPLSFSENLFSAVNSLVQGSDEVDYPLGYSPFDFPAGVKIGKQLHSFFEKHQLNRPLAQEQIALLCEQIRLGDEWLAPLEHWLTCILNTPLLPTNSAENICLAQLKPQDCLKELEFYLQLKSDFDVVAFNQLLAQYYPEAEPLQLDYVGKHSERMKGLLRGFIDLVFRHQGRYYILDYKSNLIGQQTEDYSAEKLHQVILQQHYHWQYLFYTLALHRYLSQRAENYQYERDFGGVLYPFLRAMNGKTHHSVYFNKPPLALIEKLGELF